MTAPKIGGSFSASRAGIVVSRPTTGVSPNEQTEERSMTVLFTILTIE